MQLEIEIEAIKREKDESKIKDSWNGFGKSKRRHEMKFIPNGNPKKM